MRVRLSGGDAMSAVDSRVPLVDIAVSSTGIVHHIGPNGRPLCNSPRRWFALEVTGRSLSGVRCCATCERLTGWRWFQ